MSRANETQIGGNHYKNDKLPNVEHWDFAWANDYDQFQYCITKYVHRHKRKDGLVDLRKARHQLDKYIELLEEELAMANEKERDFSSGITEAEALHYTRGE